MAYFFAACKIQGRKGKESFFIIHGGRPLGGSRVDDTKFSCLAAEAGRKKRRKKEREKKKIEGVHFAALQGLLRMPYGCIHNVQLWIALRMSYFL
jgi:hypothetical protein